ncbi:hypothetical protein BJ878DRAFT_496662 [Calycina marina]|uniref:Uncharacterized protein n=1 Tax=Calycina marina TaxID=1763456 RepID=A0A9P7Z6L2_9HELO|nr:hypothetical protein BJ878DRAFT_496662 [Calycina marina]
MSHNKVRRRRLFDQAPAYLHTILLPDIVALVIFLLDPPEIGPCFFCHKFLIPCPLPYLRWRPTVIHSSRVASFSRNRLENARASNSTQTEKNKYGHEAYQDVAPWLLKYRHIEEQMLAWMIVLVICVARPKFRKILGGRVKSCLVAWNCVPCTRSSWLCC